MFPSQRPPRRFQLRIPPPAGRGGLPFGPVSLWLSPFQLAVTGDFSLSVMSGGPGILLSFLWATKASISLRWSNSVLARPRLF